MQQQLVYSVEPYSIESLRRILTSHIENDTRTVLSKPHIAYFKTYFGELKAQTLVVEEPYIDRDFLDDFSGYYDRCYEDYQRKCKRVHFFDIALSEKDFDSLLSKPAGPAVFERFQDSYLGFIVVKRLPDTVVGRTCLKTYPDDNGRRRFPIVRKYVATLFGLPLEVSTLAFQEQDRSVSTCATSALWSAFQGTGILFHHHIPSPVEVTKAATIRFPNERAFPSRGLEVLQMVDAIRNMDLDPLSTDVSDSFVFKATLYAYVSGRIPVLLGIKYTPCTGPQSPRYHAVAVTGYSLGGANAEPYGPREFRLKSSRMDQLYVHDDQVGPFAKMPFEPSNTHKKPPRLLQVWTDLDGTTKSHKCEVEFALVPLYNKIRIAFADILRIITQFDGILASLRSKGFISSIPAPFEWDIVLSTVNDFKTEFLFSQKVRSEALRKRVLLASLPRYLWRARGWIDDVAELDLLFDATDIEQGRIFVMGISYSDSVSRALKEISIYPEGKDELQGRPVKFIFEWFARS